MKLFNTYFHFRKDKQLPFNDLSNWNQLKDNLYFEDGSLRDIYIGNSDRNDLKKWISYVNEHYRIEWYNPIIEDYEKKIDLELISDILDGKIDLVTHAKIFIEGSIIIAHSFRENEIENDIEPKEFKSIEDHYRLIEYIKAISKLLNKKIVLTPENMHEIVLISVDGDKIEFK